MVRNECLNAHTGPFLVREREHGHNQPMPALLVKAVSCIPGIGFGLLGLTALGDHLITVTQAESIS